MWPIRFWDPAIIIENLLFRWPPLICSGVYLAVLYVVGLIGTAVRVPARVTWIVTALPAALLIAYLYVTMYESTR